MVNATGKTTKKTAKKVRKKASKVSTSTKANKKAAPSKKNKTKAPSRKRTVKVVDPILRQQMIAETAYFNAQQRNFTPGNDIADWLSAETEVDRKLSKQ